MARIAMDETTDLSIRAQMFKELAQYMALKRKAVEMKAEGQLSFVDVIRSINQRRSSVGGPKSTPLLNTLASPSETYIKLCA
jgi:hypothetical protein